MENSKGLEHSLVLFWTKSKRKFDKGREFYELKIDVNKYHIIGCDDHETTKLLLYRSRLVRSNIRSYLNDTTCKGVIDRVFKKCSPSPEMSPDISFYSEDEYPHRDFALSCGVRSSFCFPFDVSNKLRVMEIVSTCNQDVATLRTFCQSFKGFDCSLSFQDIDVQKHAVQEIDHLLDVVSHKFQLPISQYWKCEGWLPYLVGQCSYGVLENLAPWCQFKDACLHKGLDEGEGPLGSSCKEPGNFFCRDITALSITRYPFVHYARNCGSISCFTMYLHNIFRQYEEWILEFFLPAQEMDNDYPQTLLNSLWATIKEHLPNWISVSEGKWGQVLSVKVIKSSSHNEPKSFKLGQHDSSLPHLEGSVSEYIRILNLIENYTGQRSNSYSSEEAATGETSKTAQTEAFQPRTSEEHFEIRGNTVAAERGNAYGDSEILNSVCSGHLLVLFWTTKVMIDNKRRGCFERAIDPNQYHIIGCDDDDRTKLLLYRSHFLGSPIRSYLDDTSGSVIDRVEEYQKSEMSPDISFYSEDEYPNRDFALSCGIRSSFCFPSNGSAKFGVVEIVSTCNQDLQTLKKFCQSIKGFDLSSSFSNLNVQKDAIPEIKHLLEVVSQTFQLPLTQNWNCKDGLPYLVQQFSHTDFENLAPWCQFKDACFHKALYAGEGPLGSSCEAFFCKDITALSITQYPFAHYVQNCGSVSCFAIYLRSFSQPYEEWILEFFLPAQEMDDDHPPTLLNSIWATIKDCLPNCELASGEQLGQVLSVEVVNSSTHNEPQSFKIGHSSPPHLEGSGYTHTSNLFESSVGQRSNSYSYEEAAIGETSKRVPIEAFQPITSEEHFKIRGTTLAAERVDEPVEESTIEDTPHATCDVDVGCAASNIDIRNAMTTAAQPFEFQTTKKTTQQEEEMMILENEGDASLQLPRISQPLYECATEQVKQVLEMKKGTPNMNSDEEIPTGALSKRTPEDVEQIISLDELEELIEPLSPTTIFMKIFSEEGYTVASEKVDNQVKVSPDENVDYAANTASKRLKPSKIPFTLENVHKHVGRPLKDAAESFGVSPSTFKRRCRSLDIKWWPPSKRKLIDVEKGKQNVSSSMRPLQDTPVISHRSQPSEKMTVKATYNGFTIKFGITNLSGVSEIEDNVIKRLHLEKNSFSIKYQDNDNESILIGCDEDVQECMNISRSAEKTTIMMSIHPPVNHSAT